MARPHLRRPAPPYSLASSTGRMIQLLSPIFPSAHSDAALAGFLGLLLVTAANNMLSPMRDAAAMSCGVEHIPTLTFISTLLALCSSVPVGWLFEAPDPARRKFLAKVGLTRGETQGTSLALFYRLFLAACLVFAVAFHLLRGTPAEPPLFAGFYLLVHVMKLHSVSLVWNVTTEAMEYEEMTAVKQLPPAPLGLGDAPPQPLSRFPSTVPLPPPPGEQGERDERGSPNPKPPVHPSSSTSPLSPPAPLDPSSEGMRAIAKKRLASLGFVGLGGTLGQIIGSSLTATYANSLNFSGLLLMSALMLEVCSRLSKHLGAIMQHHWEIAQKSRSSDNLTSLVPPPPEDATLDPCIKRVESGNNLSGGMKKVGSGNSLFTMVNVEPMKRSRESSSTSAKSSEENSSTSAFFSFSSTKKETALPPEPSQRATVVASNVAPRSESPSTINMEADSFKARLLRGVMTILNSRLLITIFTYNALYASTTTLLSFQRAELVAGRSKESSAESDTAFLASINVASSLAVMAMQASGLGARVAHRLGMEGTLVLMPSVRFGGVFVLFCWFIYAHGKPPKLALFLTVDEFTRVINFAVAKPVRESLWRGLSNEARYEAKPLVDTLANRWGGGSAAFLVALVGWCFGKDKTFFGFPPSLVLVVLIAFWWAAIAVRLGKVRNKIDTELKKMQ
ncbi:hypothetical protein TeGR_g14466 [Tetraparma gracilis]|uniref:ADP,ATP carrier protein n=1 Tax=Tetraparma gracilis TaxID=2962635 RepID=A0ABQ6MN58_9STRA|nr:hypothetical protein TeGR_g14466 [Tetraparma gracilis]